MSEGSIQWENVSNISVAYPLEPSDLELGSVQLHWTERIKHQILLLRLQRPYFIYCLMCSFIAATAFLSTLIDLCFGSEKGWHDILEGGTWQSACWSAVSLALFAEVLSNLFINWPVKSFSQDWWLIFDVTLLVLTVPWRESTVYSVYCL